MGSRVDSRGYVQFHDAASYNLPKPYITAVDRMTDGPGYMTTVFHQLHCLVCVVRSFQSAMKAAACTKSHFLTGFASRTS